MSGGIVSLSEARALAAECELIPGEWADRGQVIRHDVEGESEAEEEPASEPAAPEAEAQAAAAKAVYGSLRVRKSRDGRVTPIARQPAPPDGFWNFLSTARREWLNQMSND